MVYEWVTHPGKGRRRQENKIDELPQCNSFSDNIKNVQQEFDAHRESVKTLITGLIKALPFVPDTLVAVGLGCVTSSRISLRQFALLDGIVKALQIPARIIEPYMSDKSKEFIRNQLNYDLDCHIEEFITEKAAVNEITVDNYACRLLKMMHDGKKLIIGFHCPPLISLGVAKVVINNPNEIVAFSNSIRSYSEQMTDEKNQIKRIAQVMCSSISEDTIGSGLDDAFYHMVFMKHKSNLLVS